MAFTTQKPLECFVLGPPDLSPGTLGTAVTADTETPGFGSVSKSKLFTSLKDISVYPCLALLLSRDLTVPPCSQGCSPEHPRLSGGLTRASAGAMPLSLEQDVETLLSVLSCMTMTEKQSSGLSSTGKTVCKSANLCAHALTQTSALQASSCPLAAS